MKSVFLFILTSLISPTFAQFHPAVLDSIMVFVKGGDFQMGSNEGKPDERPVHTVKLSDFYICQYEVTQSLWQQVTGNTQGIKSDCSECPVYDINWETIQSFLTKLNQLTGRQYRLPTEAEWEYAATGGEKSHGYKYSGSNNLDEVAWYEPNAGMKTHPVGLKKPNELGICDMSGNVWELCSDWYQKSFYQNSPAENPVSSKVSSYRVSRGGSWRSPEQRCQVRARNKDIRDHHIGNGGFRLVMEPNKDRQEN
ncbi:MAG: formylglycine-generating enzyme family protein [Sphingobacteriales bacterium]|nr:formylglycine-generating enzyme family protein [Sphingobacteriales bacterium]